MCDPFHHLVFKLSRMLSKEDEEALAYVYRLPADIMLSSSSANGLPYFMELEKRDIFSPSNLTGLKEILNIIQRCDLIEMVEQYEKQVSSSTSGYRRPQEERTRLENIYAQATNLEVQLSEFQKEFTSFCSKFREPSGVTQLYTGMVKRLHDMRDDCHRKITIPLFKVVNWVQPSTATGPSVPAHSNSMTRHQQVPQTNHRSSNSSRPNQAISVRRNSQQTGFETGGQREPAYPPQYAQAPSHTMKRRSSNTPQGQPIPQTATNSRIPDSTGSGSGEGRLDLTTPILLLPPCERTQTQRDSSSATRGASSSPRRDRRISTSESTSMAVGSKKDYRGRDQNGSYNTKQSSRSLCVSPSSRSRIPPASDIRKASSADDILNTCESRIPKSSSRLYHLVGARSAHKSSYSDISSSSESSTSSSSTSLGYKSRSSTSCSTE